MFDGVKEAGHLVKCRKNIVYTLGATLWPIFPQNDCFYDIPVELYHGWVGSKSCIREDTGKKWTFAQRAEQMLNFSSLFKSFQKVKYVFLNKIALNIYPASGDRGPYANSLDLDDWVTLRLTQIQAVWNSTLNNFEAFWK